jgi:hypothetical protein
VAVGWEVVVLLNDGLGGFAPGVTLPGNGGNFVRVADIDGVDGPDILVADGAGRAVFLNDGSGGFTGPTSFAGVARRARGRRRDRTRCRRERGCRDVLASGD